MSTDCFWSTKLTVVTLIDITPKLSLKSMCQLTALFGHIFLKKRYSLKEQQIVAP